MPQDASLVMSTDLTLKEIEKRAIQTALHRNQWRKVATARELGIDKNTLRAGFYGWESKNRSEPRLTVALKRFYAEFIAGSGPGGKSIVNSVPFPFSPAT